MTYTAFSPLGPRIALAISEDLFTWRRVGLARFRTFEGVSFDGVDDKDASLFPTRIPGPGARPEETMLQARARAIDPDRECI